MIPELNLYKYLEAITAILIEDLRREDVIDKTILFQILGEVEFKGDSYYEIAKELFLRSDEHPRKIQLNYAFMQEKAALPSLSLSTPAESPDAALDSFGVGEEIYKIKEGVDNIESKYPILSRNYKASINVVISSSNFIEQTILFHVYRSMLMAVIPQLQLDGFINPTFSGREVQVNPELIATNIYVRMLTVGFSYKTEVQGIVAKRIIDAICVGGPKQILISHPL